MNDYKVITSDNTNELQELVNMAMNEGYKLAGGVSTSLVSDRVFFFQAVVYNYNPDL